MTISKQHTQTMKHRLTARERRNQENELLRQGNSNVGSKLAEFLAEPPGLATAMGAGSYAGSPAWAEDRREAKKRGA